MHGNSRTEFARYLPLPTPWPSPGFQSCACPGRSPG